MKLCSSDNHYTTAPISLVFYVRDLFVTSSFISGNIFHRITKDYFSLGKLHKIKLDFAKSDYFFFHVQIHLQIKMATPNKILPYNGQWRSWYLEKVRAGNLEKQYSNVENPQTKKSKV